MKLEVLASGGSALLLGISGHCRSLCGSRGNRSGHLEVCFEDRCYPPWLRWVEGGQGWGQSAAGKHTGRRSWITLDHTLGICCQAGGGGEVYNHEFAVVTKINDHLGPWQQGTSYHLVPGGEKLGGPSPESSRGAQRPCSPLGE